jgi:hypothetical protein
MKSARAAYDALSLASRNFGRRQEKRHRESQVDDEQEQPPRTVPNARCWSQGKIHFALSIVLVVVAIISQLL